jgi:hypothetical protein
MQAVILLQLFNSDTAFCIFLASGIKKKKIFAVFTSFTIFITKKIAAIQLSDVSCLRERNDRRIGCRRLPL